MSISVFLLAHERDIPRDRDAAWRQAYEEWGYSRSVDEGHDLAAFAAASRQPSRVSIADLLFHGGYREVAPARGGRAAHLSSHQDAAHFDLQWDGADDVGAMIEVARAYGGECLAARTYGSRLAMALARGGAPAEFLSLALARPGDGARPEWPWKRLEKWFQASAQLRPDLARLRALYEAAEIDVPAWLEALGVPGATVAPAEGPNPEALSAWADFARVAEWLMGMGPADAPARKRLNALLEDEPVPAKPPRAAARARSIWGPWATLERRYGAPFGPASAGWGVRAVAADLYDRITSGPAGTMLTLGQGKQGLGESAALGRLLAHYPKEACRDGVALALIARDAEVWNGHAFVRGSEALAAGAREAGFTLAVYPSVLRPGFRKTFGLELAEEETRERDGWTADAFLDLPGVLKAKPVESLAAWFERSKADGLMVRAEPEGRAEVTFFRGGLKTERPPAGLDVRRDDAALAEAARALWPREALAALGLPDLLEPGEIAVREGGALQTYKPPDALCRRLETLFADLPAPRSLDAPEDLLRDFPARIFYRGVANLSDEELSLPPEQGPIIAFRLTVPTEDRAFLGRLARDLPATAWADGRNVYAWRAAVSGWIGTRELLNALADIPRGTTLAIEHHGDTQAHYLLDWG